MKEICISKSKGLRGTITPPPDKSISHRAVMFSGLASGKCRIRNLLHAGDTISTMKAIGMLGVEISENISEVVVMGKGLRGLKEPVDVIDCGNSGTTSRLLSGILAGNDFFSVLTGDASLRQRPMSRIINPLRQMGALILARDGDRLLPMSIRGGGLKGINYSMPVASAQVKSCLMLAGLYADCVTCIIEPIKSRDHTEKLLSAMGVRVVTDEGDYGHSVTIYPPSSELQPLDITVPADISSAAFFIAAALIVPDSELTIKGVLLNPTRSGFLEAIKLMGAEVRVSNTTEASGEIVGDLYCKTAHTLKAISIDKALVPSMIDEFPILCVLASKAEGITEIRGAEELRVKESDRISAMATELSRLGVEVIEYPDGIAIKGTEVLRGTRVKSYGDHRIAMAMAVAGLAAEGTTVIEDCQCVSISFPNFFETLSESSKNG